MRKLPLIFLAFCLLGATETKFVYGQKVKIVGGFYRGQVGTIDNGMSQCGCKQCMWGVRVSKNLRADVYAEDLESLDAEITPQ